MTACNYQYVDGDGNIIGEETSSETQENPLLKGNSDSKLFEGTRCNPEDVPVVQQRTEEEIAETGLTAQDVLNAYDQFTIDICKQLYSADIYGELSEEAYNNLSAQFISISPWSSARRDKETGEFVEFSAPFYAVTDSFTATKYGNSISTNDPHFSVYPVTIDFTTYIDGVYFVNSFSNTGIQISQFEKTMEAFNKEQYFLDQFTLTDMVDDYYKYAKFANQNAYDGFVINRDTILNATPDQLKALYNMIASLRSINLEQRLLDESELDFEK